MHIVALILSAGALAGNALLESVHRGFRKRIETMIIAKLSYIKRLGVFNLESLKLRTLRFDLTLTLTFPP